MTVWVPDRAWRPVAPGDARVCRMPRCGKPAVAEFNRGKATARGRIPDWWAYCEDHLYGHRIDGDVVLVEVPSGSAPAEAGELPA